MPANHTNDQRKCWYIKIIIVSISIYLWSLNSLILSRAFCNVLYCIVYCLLVSSGQPLSKSRQEYYAHNFYAGNLCDKNKQLTRLLPILLISTPQPTKSCILILFTNISVLQTTLEYFGNTEMLIVIGWPQNVQNSIWNVRMSLGMTVKTGKVLWCFD